MEETSNFTVALLDEPELPKYEEYFFQEPIWVHTLFMYVHPPLSPSFPKIRYYIDHYSVLEYISEYKWNVARHDIHQFVNPRDYNTQQVFDDMHDDTIPIWGTRGLRNSTRSQKNVGPKE